MDIATEPTPAHPTIRSLCTSDSAIRAAHLLRSCVGEVVVVTPTGRAAGLLAARDIVASLTVPGATIDTLDVIDMMRPMG